MGFLSGTGPSDMYAASDDSWVILHSIGDGTWQSIGQPPACPTCYGSGLWAAAPGELYAADGVTQAGIGHIYHEHFGVWSVEATVAGYPKGFWGSGPQDIYVTVLPYPVTGYQCSNLFHSMGNGTWTPLALPSKCVYGVWGDSATDVYAGSSDGLLHWSGSGVWTLAAPGPNAVMPLGGAGTDLFSIAAPNGTGGWSDGLLHFSGRWGNWEQEAQVPGKLNGMWVGPGDDVYAVGSQPDARGTGSTIVHRGSDGTWRQEIDPAFNQGGIAAVWASGTDVYAAGGVILHRAP
jgi:hypothetical protein